MMSRNRGLVGIAYSGLGKTGVLWHGSDSTKTAEHSRVPEEAQQAQALRLVVSMQAFIALANGMKRRAWRYGLLVALLAAASLGLAGWAYPTFLGSNWHTVVPGQIYRSAQLSPTELVERIERFGIRTVINLRGCCEGMGWYEEQKQALEGLGVRQWDIRLSYRSPPAVPELRRLVQALRTSDRPILLHCRRGADRTGLAASIAVLLQGGSVAAARRQFSLSYGYFPAGGPARLRQVLDWYEAWLNPLGLSHSPENFQRWVEEAYRPGHLWAQVEPLDVPVCWPVGRSVPARFRVVNRSDFPWHFRTTPRTGVHLRAWLLPDDREITDPAQLDDLPTDAAGFFEATVASGDALELTIGLPRTRTAGWYVLLVDLVDAEDGPFCTYGSAAFRQWVHVE